MYGNAHEPIISYHLGNHDVRLVSDVDTGKRERIIGDKFEFLLYEDVEMEHKEEDKTMEVEY
jgi:hypothetical protein